MRLLTIVRTSTGKVTLAQFLLASDVVIDRWLLPSNTQHGSKAMDEFNNSIEVFEDNSAVLMNWWDNEPVPYQVIDRMTAPIVDYLFAEHDEHGRIL